MLKRKNTRLKIVCLMLAVMLYWDRADEFAVYPFWGLGFALGGEYLLQ